MLKLSRKTILALEAVVDIAHHARPEPVQAKEITARLGIPQRYLEQVMQHLVHEGVLKGVRGPRGGYRLARERRRITVGEVVRLVSQLETTIDEADGQADSPLGEKIVRPMIEGAITKMLNELDAVTIEDLCDQAKETASAAEQESSVDFTI